MAIERIFPEYPDKAKEFKSIGLSVPPRPILVPRSGDIPPRDGRPFYLSGLKSTSALLRSMIQEIEEYWPESSSSE